MGISKNLPLQHNKQLVTVDYCVSGSSSIGHIHNNTTNDTYKIMKKIKNAYNVGADILNFSPQTLSDVIEINQNFWKKH